MNTINKKLEWLSKEQIIKRFVSVEFNRFLEYYKDAPDLNENSEIEQGKSHRRDSGSRRDKNRREAETGYTRFFINIGKKDGVVPKNIIGMINDSTNNRNINIGAIDLKDSYSFFEVEEKHSSRVLNSFRKHKFKGRPLKVALAGENRGSGKKGKHVTIKHYPK